MTPNAPMRNVLSRRERSGTGPTTARNLLGRVVQLLGKRIVSGELKSGDVLPPEAIMAEEMEVSRTLLREAMKVLSAKGLVEARPKVGTRVRDARFWNQLSGKNIPLNPCPVNFNPSLYGPCIEKHSTTQCVVRS
jgi:DNA-binding GntR family transcriptional regulator